MKRAHHLIENYLTASSQKMSSLSTSSQEANCFKDFTPVKPDPDELEYNVNKTSQGVSNQQIALQSSPVKIEVKEEIMYCQICPYSDFDFDRLKFHTFKRHPTGVAVVNFGELEQDMKFFCVKETCNFATTMCTVYEEHLMNCCPLHQTLSGKEKERLKSTLQFILDFHNNHCLSDVTGIVEFFSSFNKIYTSEHDQALLKKHMEPKNLSSAVSRSSSISEGQSSMACEDKGERKRKGLLLSVPNPVPVFIVQNQNLVEGQAHISETISMVAEEQIKNNEQLLKNGPSELKISRSQVNSYMSTQTGKKPDRCVEDYSDLPIHLRINSVEKQFKCHVCDKEFTRSRYLKVHKRTHMCDKPFKCDVCHKGCNSSSHLKVHKRIHTGEKPYKCDLCDKEFISSSCLNAHKKIHTGKKPFKCDMCHKEFISSSHLNVHKRTHTGEKPYKCEVCDKEFNTSSYLNVHKRTHTGEKPYKCEVCDKNFARSSDFIVHKRIHTGEKPFKCTVCDKEFIDSGTLIRHKRIHIDEKPFKCNVCEKDFNHSATLSRHKVSHTCEKPFKCNMCDKKFLFLCHLKVHERTHTGEKPFKCNVCDKSFALPSTLGKHERTHTGEKPFKCDLCDKKYATSSDLIVHKRTHTGEKPFRCNICDKSFTVSSSLSKHKRTHTG